ncbi:MAG: hypothetical protein ABIF85_06130 [Nanoarchaeota archaeon]
MFTKDKIESNVYKNTGTAAVNEVARTFFYSKVKLALFGLKKRGTRPHRSQMEKYKLTRAAFSAPFFAQRMSRNEVKFIINLLEKNGKIRVNGNSFIDIVDDSVLRCPEDLMYLFDCVGDEK